MRRRCGRAVAVLVAAAVPLTASTSAAQAAPSAQARLASVATHSPNRKVVAIAQFKPGLSERTARALVRSHDGRVTNRLPAINGFAIELPAREARSLRRSRRVLNVTLNTRVRNAGIDASTLATNYPQTIGADKAWAAGITGKGVGVAVIDSGVNGDLAGLQARRRQLAHHRQCDRQRRRDPRPATTSATARTSPASSPATPSTAIPPTRRAVPTSASLPRPS